MTRYQMLREAVANLAAPAEEQVAYLDRIFVPLTGGGSAAGYGNDELALELEDIAPATADMMDFGEITAEEVEAVKAIDLLIAQYQQEHDPVFWRREALFDDPRWQNVREVAAQALAQLPDEARESDYTRELAERYAEQPDDRATARPDTRSFVQRAIAAIRVLFGRR